MGAKTQVQLDVLRTEDLSPSLRRLVFGGPGFAQYAPYHRDETDTYVKLRFPTSEGTLRRTYTVRHVDHEAGELWIDFVIHGDAGLAGPWAARAVPGDRIEVTGPGGGYRPRADVDHHLFVGDESALPAIAASLAAVPAGMPATAFLEVDGPDHQITLETSADLTVHWLHRAGSAPGTTSLLDDAVRAWPWPGGRVQAFVHGESRLLKTVRPYLLDGRVHRKDISVSAYWRRGVDEAGFRQWKSTQSHAVMRPDAEGRDR